MKNDGSYLNEFLKSLNSLTGKQLEKIGLLNEFIETYHVLKIKEEKEYIKFSGSNDSGNYFLSLLRGKKEREYFMVAFLGSGNRVIETRVISKGIVNQALVDPRDILKIALANDSVSIILAHNHPGSSIRASSDDKNITQRIVDIFWPLNIKVLDHIIIGGNSYSSMAENGILPDGVLHKADYSIIELNEEELDSELVL